MPNNSNHPERMLELAVSQLAEMKEIDQKLSPCLSYWRRRADRPSVNTMG